MHRGLTGLRDEEAGVDGAQAVHRGRIPHGAGHRRLSRRFLAYAGPSGVGLDRRPVALGCACDDGVAGRGNRVVERQMQQGVQVLDVWSARVEAVFCQACGRRQCPSDRMPSGRQSRPATGTRGRADQGRAGRGMPISVICSGLGTQLSIHRVPSGPSLIWIPTANKASRIASAAAKSLFARAWFRFCTSLSIAS